MSTESIDRRAFLTFRTRGSESVLELWCEHLFMRWVDAQSAASRSGEAIVEMSPWEGEPPTEFQTATTLAILEELEARLSAADLLRVRNPEWLSDAGFRGEVEERIERFRRRGGRVEEGLTASDANGEAGS